MPGTTATTGDAPGSRHARRRSHQGEAMTAKSLRDILLRTIGIYAATSATASR
jgi:hypothetical protein